MRRIAPIAGSLLIVALLLAWAGRPARADTLSVSADVPIAYAFSDPGYTGTAAHDGLVVGVSLPILLGLGYEAYQVTGTLAAQDFTYDVRMADVFFDLPFPTLNLRLGGGVGVGRFDVAATPGAYDPAKLSQFFLNVGIPFAGLFDAHVGYHIIQGKADIVGTGNTLPLGATMATVGLKVGF